MKILKKNNELQNSGKYMPMRSIFDDFFTMPSVIDELFNQNYAAKNLFADIWEENDNYVIKMAMPGVDKHKINIEMAQDSITIKATSKQEEKEEDKKKYYCKSIESSYEQTFNLPSSVNAEKTEAKYEDGVLTVKLPKSEEVKTKKIAIK